MKATNKAASALASELFGDEDLTALTIVVITTVVKLNLYGIGPVRERLGGGV